MCTGLEPLLAGLATTAGTAGTAGAAGAAGAGAAAGAVGTAAGVTAASSTAASLAAAATIAGAAASIGTGIYGALNAPDMKAGGGVKPPALVEPLSIKKKKPVGGFRSTLLTGPEGVSGQGFGTNTLLGA